MIATLSNGSLCPLSRRHKSGGSCTHGECPNRAENRCICSHTGHEKKRILVVSTGTTKRKHFFHFCNNRYTLVASIWTAVGCSFLHLCAQHKTHPVFPQLFSGPPNDTILSCHNHALTLYKKNGIPSWSLPPLTPQHEQGTSDEKRMRIHDDQG